MFNGYLSLGGTEIINSSRTEAYLSHQLATFPLKARINATDLPGALGDEPYESALTDNAPWVDASRPETAHFYGLYPVSIVGDIDSTMDVTITEAITDGASASAPRAASRQIKVNALLLARDEMSLDAGMAWLRAALYPQDCDGDGTSLCFYAGEPSVCTDYTGQPVETTTTAFGSVTPSTSPVIGHFLASLGKAQATWAPPYADGVMVKWGALDLMSATVRQETAPTLLQRTNFLPNPSFSIGTDNWTSGGPISFLRIPTGGADDGAYAQIGPSTPPAVRTNWIANSSLQSDPNSNGWTTTGAATLDTVEDDTAPFGTSVLQVTPDLTLGTLEVDIPILGPTSVDDEVGSFYLKNENLVTSGFSLDLAIVDGSGAVVQHSTFTTPPSSQWTRYAIATPALAGAGYSLRVRLNTPSDVVFMDSFDVEEGTSLKAYFDGSLPNDSSYNYSFADGTPNSPSLATPVAVSNLFIKTPNFDISVQPMTLSLQTESAVAADVLIEQVSTLDGTTVLASATIQPTNTWSEFSVTFPAGRNFFLRLSTNGAYDLDQAMLEIGTEPDMYVDGNIAPPDGYTASWTGAFENSASMIRFDPELITTIIGDLDWRPFFSVVSGSLPSLELTTLVTESKPLSNSAIRFERHLNNVVTVSPPTVVQTYDMNTGAMVQVSFGFDCDPWIFGTPVDVLDPELPHLVDPFTITDGITFVTDPLTGYTPVSTLPHSPLNDASIVCPVTPIAIIVDPDCPAIPAPPTAPTIANACIANITNWTRYFVPVDGENIAAWSSTIPVVTLQSGGDAIRQLRVRFHPNPFNYDFDDVDPCSYCAEFIVSYLPAGTTMIIDGEVKRAMANVNGAGPQPVDNLIFGTAGIPMTWPELTCGIPYLMTVDADPTAIVDDLAIGLTLTRRE